MLKFFAASDLRCGYEKRDETCIPEAMAEKIKSIMLSVGKDVRFIVDLGDSMCEDLAPEKASELFRDLFYTYDSIADVYSVMGERDFLLTREKYLELNDYSMRYRAFDRSDYRCIFLDCCVADEEGSVHFELDDEQFSWLSRLLGKSHRPAIIFLHAPVAVSDPADEDKLLKNSKELRQLIESSQKVSLVVSGHLDHGDFVLSNKVPYVTLSPMNSGEEATFAEITVSSRGVDIKGHGAQDSHSVPKETEKSEKETLFSKLKKLLRLR